MNILTKITFISFITFITFISFITFIKFLELGLEVADKDGLVWNQSRGENLSQHGCFKRDSVLSGSGRHIVPFGVESGEV